MLPSLLDPIEDGQPSYDSFMESVGVDDYLSSREALPLTSPWDFGNGPICSNINALGFAPDFTSTLSQCSGTLEYALASSWMLSVHEEEILYSLPSAVSPALLSPCDPTFEVYHAGTSLISASTPLSMPPQPHGVAFSSPDLFDVSLPSTSPSTSYSELSSPMSSPPIAPGNLTCTTSPETSFASLPPPSDYSSSSSSASDSRSSVGDWYSFRSAENPTSCHSDDSSMVSEPPHGCSASPSASPTKPSRRKRAVRITPTASSRKRSTKAQSARKSCRAKLSTSDSSYSSSSSRQTSEPSSYEKRFFPEFGCTLRIVHGEYRRTKSRSSQLSVDLHDPAVIDSYWEGDRCVKCSRTVRRKQDKRRHLFISHSQEKFWYCDGVPLAEAAGLGIAIRDNDVVKSWDHIDQLTIGGCGRVLRREDALQRHIHDSCGRCMHKDFP